MKKMDLTTGVARWALLLEEFDFWVEHRAGTGMRHVDALSRNPVPAVTCLRDDNGFLKKLADAQQKDEGLSAILGVLKDGPYKDFIVHHGLLCKNINNSVIFVVPESMRCAIIRDAHERGHFCAQKMKEILEKDFFIPNLDRRIERCVSSCVKCILADRKREKAEGLLHPIPKGDAPLATFHADHLGPMQDTKKGYRYILAFIDGFTKFCWLFPTKSLGSDEVILKMEIIAETFGYPHNLITDRGGAFTSNNVQGYCKDHDVKVHPSVVTVGVPRGNGQVERLHTTVIAALTKLSSEYPDKWYQHTKPLQRVLNSTFHRSIKTTPFQLMTGTTMKTGNKLEIMKLIEEEFQKQYEDARLEQRNQAREAIAAIQAENTTQFNKRRRKATNYSVVTSWLLNESNLERG